MYKRLIFQVAGRGPLRLEKLGHKLGYRLKDADGELAPVVERSPEVSGNYMVEEPSEAEMLESQRILGASGVKFSSKDEVQRGFGEGYEDFDDEIHTGQRAWFSCAARLTELRCRRQHTVQVFEA
jgi:pyroglutamyl-peptidase